MIKFKNLKKAFSAFRAVAEKGYHNEHILKQSPAVAQIPYDTETLCAMIEIPTEELKYMPKDYIEDTLASYLADGIKSYMVVKEELILEKRGGKRYTAIIEIAKAAGYKYK